ncbi:uncharacterized protein [Euwallacea similis]|uniref:uncharacterized protein n=1 Tax=Euwallacea similis TaxID=1736056 RepID=UPI0034500FD4
MAPDIRELRCLQINLDRKRVATDLLHQVIRERGVDVVLGQEPNKAAGNEIRDRCDDAFIWLANHVEAKSIHRGRGFVAVELGWLTLVSAYFSPNKGRAQFEAFLSRLEGYVRGLDGRRVLIAGDLNAKSGRFGSRARNAYGLLLDEFLDAGEFSPLNHGGEWTFGNRNGRSLIDVTMAGAIASGMVEEWRVESETESGSGHRYVSFSIRGGGGAPRADSQGESKKGWIVNPSGLEKLRQYVADRRGTDVADDPERIVKEISHVCDECLRKKNVGRSGTRKAAYWWNEEVCRKEERVCEGPETGYERES